MIVDREVSMARKTSKKSEPTGIKPTVVSGILNDSLEMMRSELMSALAENDISLTQDDQRVIFDSATRAMNVVQSRVIGRIGDLVG